MKDVQVCSECGGAVNISEGIRALLSGMPKCPLGYTANPTRKKAADNAKKNGGFAGICVKNPWKYE